MSLSPQTTPNSVTPNSAAPTIALSMGDPAGIGPEIILKAWLQDPATMRHCCIAGDIATMQRAHAICRHLEALPVDLVYREYPCAHSIHPQELRDSMQWLAQRTAA